MYKEKQRIVRFLTFVTVAILVGPLAGYAVAQDHSDHGHEEAGHQHDEQQGSTPGALGTEHVGYEDHSDTGDEGHGGHSDHGDHAPDADHDDHDDHASEVGHDDHDDHGEGGIRLTEEAISELDMEISRSSSGTLRIDISLAGEVRLNGDRLAHVVPRLPGIVTEVRSSLGDVVTRGQVMAVLESRDLADLKATYLAARERLVLSEATLVRETRLFERKVSAESDLLEARRNSAESKIEAQAAAQRLFALGFDDTTVADLAQKPNASLTRYEVRAPIDGMVISKHVTLGEAVADDADVYTVADLGTVWVDLSVYPGDLTKLQIGQSVMVQSFDNKHEDSGRVVFVSPVIAEDTRTALARVLLENSHGHWRPGLFVEGRVVTDSEHVQIKVPHSAIQTINSQPQVFVVHDDSFEPVIVELGRSDDEGVEVLSGLRSGDRYVSRGGFFLKAELEKEAFAHSGHAH